MKTFILALSLSLVGCVPQSQIVSTSGPSRSSYAPLNEPKHKGGTMVYGTGSFRDGQAKEDAYKKMHDFCGGDYNIDKSYNKNVSDTSTNYYDGRDYTTTTTDIYLDFTCAK